MPQVNSSAEQNLSSNFETCIMPETWNRQHGNSGNFRGYQTYSRGTILQSHDDKNFENMSSK